MKEQVTRILCSLTNKYKEKVTAIEEVSYLTTLQVEDLIGNFQNYEVKIQAREQKEEYATKKKMTFKAASERKIPHQMEFKKMNKEGSSKQVAQDKIWCFNCSVQGHYKNECPWEKKSIKEKSNPKKGESSNEDDAYKKRKHRSKRVHTGPLGTQT